MAKQPKPDNCGIYQFLAHSGHCYIGQSRTLQARRWQHNGLLRAGTHGNFILQRAYDAHDGKLVYAILELCPVEMLDEREQWWIDNTDSKYNIVKDGSNLHNSPLFRELHRAGVGSAECRGKMSRSHTERYKDPAECLAQSERQLIAQNRPEVLEANRQRSLINGAKPEVKAKLSASGKIAQNRPEVRANNSAKQKIAQNRPERKIQMSATATKQHDDKRQAGAVKFDLVGLDFDQLCAIRCLGRRKDATPEAKARANAANSLYRHLKRQEKNANQLQSTN